MKLKETADLIYDLIILVLISMLMISAIVITVTTTAKYLLTGLIAFNPIYAAGMMILIAIVVSVYFVKINSIKK
jgi:hypothetical protein